MFEKGDAGDVGRGVLERRQGVTLFEEANGLSWSLSPVSTIDLASCCLLLKISGSLTQCFLVVRASNRCFFSPVIVSHKTTRQISKQVRSNAVSEVQAVQYRK